MRSAAPAALSPRGLGGLLVVGAGFNGASFLDFGHDTNSLVMVLLALAAVGSYAVALFLLGETAAAGREPDPHVRAGPTSRAATDATPGA